MVLNYIITIIFFIAFGLFYLLIGTVFYKGNRKLESTRVITGFLIHTFLLAICGIIVQVFNLPWMLFFCISIFWSLFCLLYGIYNVRKNKYEIFNDGISNFFRKYWFFLILICIFSILLICSTERIWSDNCTDDAYYFVKIASIPYNNFINNIETGFQNSAMFTYNLNTWELESSVYLYILHVLPSIYVRFGMSIFNFVLILCGLHSLIGKINNKFGFNKDEVSFQYYCFLIIPIFYSINTLSQSFVSLDLEDTWKNTSAMYYGSTVVRLLLPIVFFDYFLSIEKLKLKDFFAAFVISVVFVSRSTVAIPFILIMGISILLTLLIKNKNFLFTGIIVFIILIFSFFISNNELLASVTRNRIIDNATSIFTIAMIFGFLIVSLIKKDFQYLYALCPTIISYFLVFFEPLNNIFEKVSNYDFVIGRVLYSFYFIFYIILIAYILISIKNQNNILKRVVATLLIIICTVSIFSTQYIYGDVVAVNVGAVREGLGLKKPLTVLKDNPSFTPDSTMNVGKSLHSLELKSKKRLKVITTFDWQNIDGYANYPAITYKAYAYSIYNYTALFRLGGDSTIYSWKEHCSICDFANNPNDNTYHSAKKILNKMKFDCIISNNKNIQDYIKNDYYLYDTIVDNNQVNAYFLFVRK